MKPEIRVFAGPNGSGKSTLTSALDILPPYFNADEIKKERRRSDLEAAQIATNLRENAVSNRISFTFETVLSTRRNVDLLWQAKDNGYFIRCAFILTVNPEINVERVHLRVQDGGHDVPDEKIRSRYYKSLLFIPELCDICDRLNIYDNSVKYNGDGPRRIFKKRNDEMWIFPNDVWTQQDILNLIIYGHK